jgi:hypothetical protein
MPTRIVSVAGRAFTIVGTKATGPARRAVRTRFLTELLVFLFFFIGG